MPRPWPLLAEGQDPASLEARVAFHLYRLKLVGGPLYKAGYHRTDAADFAAGRFTASPKLLRTLAQRLGVTLDDLTRELAPEEARAWAFYRAAAARPDYVWEAARAAWIAHGLTDTEAAKIMDLSNTAIRRARHAPFVLTFAAALRLATALRSPQGPEAFLPPSRPEKSVRER